MKVAIIGAGPAGMSCANAAITFGLRPLVIERSAHLGGAQRENFHANLWLLGTGEESGADMTQRLVAHFQKQPVEIATATEVLAVHARGARFVLDVRRPAGRPDIDAFDAFDADAVVLATGTRAFAPPALHALARQSPRVIIGPVSSAIRDHVRGGRVLILGGGDNALDHALFLVDRGNTVDVCTRAAFSARRQFVDDCRARARITLCADWTAERIEADAERVAVTRAGQIQHFDWLLVMYGYVPNVEILDRFDADVRPRLTDAGYIAVDSWLRTTVRGVYAAGDVTEQPQPSVPTAMAQGLLVARAIERDLGPYEPDTDAD